MEGGDKMGRKYGVFKYSIGDVISTHGRNLLIIGREYRQKEKTNNGRRFIANEKFYNYKCLDCGNEDWVVEFSLDELQHCGCNACCKYPKKLVCGINDVGTTSPWAVRLFKNKEDSLKYHKYSNEKVEFVCPDCGRTYIKPICNVIANNGLSCVCSDKISYPNKFMFSILEQSGIDFEIEKAFEWSNSKRYDFYIPDYNAIIEMHGKQHYERPIIKSDKYRSVLEEMENDAQKELMAKDNGISNYYQIDCSESNKDYVKNSIISSGLFPLLGIECGSIDWDKCDMFATSNFARTICEFKENNPNCTLHSIAKIFKVSYKTVLSYIKIGKKYGWCSYCINDDRKISEKTINRGVKPIYCFTNDTYYRDANTASVSLSCEDNPIFPRQLRQSIARKGNYKGFKFDFVPQSEFNYMKIHFPNKVVGDLIYICNYSSE